MHRQSLAPWQHEHLFLGETQGRNERRLWLVIALTAATMVLEIAAGTLFGSLALLADGWHMATHVGALGISAFAYRYARRHARDPRFSFGTGKLGDLAGFASAVVLAMVALFVAYESVLRLAQPVPIRFGEAIAVAVLGLAVNLLCAWLLREAPAHHHGQGHHHDHHHRHGRDHNLRAAHLHVLADALTSVLAIVGLLAGRLYGWLWMDACVGLIGALVIARWSWGLLRNSGAVLLDTLPDPALAEQARRRLEVGEDRVADLHLWRIGPGHSAAVITLVSHRPQPPNHYKGRLAGLPGLSHVTVEVQPCPGPAE